MKMWTRKRIEAAATKAGYVIDGIYINDKPSPLYKNSFVISRLTPTGIKKRLVVVYNDGFGLRLDVHPNVALKMKIKEIADFLNLTLDN
jgi:hypothetical protein